jgi:hypothetical protein
MTPETSPHKISLFLLDSWANCFFLGGNFAAETAMKGWCL